MQVVSLVVFGDCASLYCPQYSERSVQNTVLAQLQKAEGRAWWMTEDDCSVPGGVSQALESIAYLTYYASSCFEKDLHGGVRQER